MFRIKFGTPATYNVSFRIMFFGAQRFVMSTNVCLLLLTRCAATFDCGTGPLPVTWTPSKRPCTRHLARH